MTRYTPLWLQSGSYAASVDRRLVGALWPTARCDGMAVSHAQAATVNIDTGNAAVPTPNGTGSTLCVSDAVEQVALPAAPAAGVNRVDGVVLTPRGTDLDGGVNNDFLYGYIQGADGVATDPVVPAGSLLLAVVDRTGGEAAVDPAAIHDRRPGALTVLTAADLWPLPRGIEGRATSGINSGGINNNVPTDLGLSITWTPTAGRKYIATAKLSITINSFGSNLYVWITDAANNQLGGSFSNSTSTAAGWPNVVRTPVLSPPGGAPITWKVRAQASSADNRLIGQAGVPHTFDIEDVGAW